MPVVNPGIRRFLGSAIQRLFNSAAFALPLTHTAVPTRGSIVPSFTRATTETGQKYDEAGYLDFTALAGEMVFKGARRVRNWIVAPTENWASAGWVKSGISVSGNRLTATGANGIIYDNAASAMGAGKTAVGSITLSRVTGTGDIQISTNGGATYQTVLANGSRVSVVSTGSNNGQFVLKIVTNGDAVDATYPQLEDVTGQTTQTASEYVSVGVASAPAYHGSMVDGVKCYDTDRSGNPISTSGSYPLVGYVPWEARTNLDLQSNALTTTWADVGTTAATQNATGPNGQANYAWTLTDNDVGAVEYKYQNRTLTAATHTSQWKIKKTTGAQSSYPVLVDIAQDGSLRAALCTVDTTNGVASVWTAFTGLTIQTSSARCTDYSDEFWLVELTFLATATAWRKQVLPAATSNPTQSTGTTDAAVTGSCVICDSQTELGSFATPYIPTTTAAVARNADILTYTGADVANIKTLAATFSRGAGVATLGEVAFLSDGTTNNFMGIGQSTATNTFIQGSVASVPQWTFDYNTYTAGTTRKASFSATTNNVLGDVGGTAATPDTSATLPTVTQLNVGHIAGILQLNGPVNHIYGWTRNLSQSELGAIDR